MESDRAKAIKESLARRERSTSIGSHDDEEPSMRYLSRGTRVNIEQYGLCETINPETGVLEVRLASEVDEEGRQKLLAMEVNEDGTRGPDHLKGPFFWEKEKFDEQERQNQKERTGKMKAMDGYDTDETDEELDSQYTAAAEPSRKQKTTPLDHTKQTAAHADGSYPYPVKAWDPKQGKYVEVESIEHAVAMQKK